MQYAALVSSCDNVRLLGVASFDRVKSRLISIPQDSGIIGKCVDARGYVVSDVNAENATLWPLKLRHGLSSHFISIETFLLDAQEFLTFCPGPLPAR